MSMDKSLKSHGALARHRNVLTRAERVEAMKEADQWAEGNTVLGMPKVANRKVATRKKTPTGAKAADSAAATPAKP